LNQEALKEAEMKKERDEFYQKSMTLYSEEAAKVTASLQEDIPDAIKQGFKALNAKKRKPIEEPSISNQNPSALCALSGELILVKNDNNGSAEIQSESEFATAVLVLDQLPTLQDHIIYYEVTLVSGGLAQIGWACLVGQLRFCPNSDFGDGVGDDVSSYGVDGSRSLKFHGGNEEKCDIQWKGGDRLGCYFDSKNHDILFAVNGSTPKKLFQLPGHMKSLVPAISCNLGEVIQLHTRREDCKFFPDGPVIAVDEMITKEEDKAKETTSCIDVRNKDSIFTKQVQPKRKLAEEKAMSTVKKTRMQPEVLDLNLFQTAADLEDLGLDRLKSALVALQVKCGGTLKERANRLFSLKGLERREYPAKVRAKEFIE